MRRAAPEPRRALRPGSALPGGSPRAPARAEYSRSLSRALPTARAPARPAVRPPRPGAARLAPPRAPRLPLCSPTLPALAPTAPAPPAPCGAALHTRARALGARAWSGANPNLDPMHTHLSYKPYITVTPKVCGRRAACGAPRHPRARGRPGARNPTAGVPGPRANLPPACVSRTGRPRKSRRSAGLCRGARARRRRPAPPPPPRGALSIKTHARRGKRVPRPPSRGGCGGPDRMGASRGSEPRRRASSKRARQKRVSF